MQPTIAELAETARSLKDCYTQLEQLKHHHQQPEARVMKARPGAQSPGNWLAVSCYIDNEQRLREVSLNAFSDLGIKIKDTQFHAIALCELIEQHAAAIIALEWVEDFCDELKGQEVIINQRVNPEARPNAARVLRHLAKKYAR